MSHSPLPAKGTPLRIALVSVHGDPMLPTGSEQAGGRLLDNEDERRRMGKAALALVRRSFTGARVAERLEDPYYMQVAPLAGAQ